MFSNRLFKKYCSKEWMVIFEMNKQSLHFKAKEIIFREGDPVQGIYFIEQGIVKVLSQMDDKTEKIIRIAGSDQLLGHRGIHFDFYHISAQALTDTNLTFLPHDIFIRILKTNPEMAIYLLNFMSEELREAEDRMKNLLIPDPKRRIAKLLLKLIENFGCLDTVPHLLTYTPSRTDIANMAGTTYETVIRTLSYFHSIKAIQLAGKEIALTDKKKLLAIAEKGIPK